MKSGSGGGWSRLGHKMMCIGGKFVAMSGGKGSRMKMSSNLVAIGVWLTIRKNPGGHPQMPLPVE